MSPLVALHAFAAATAFFLGAWQLFGSRKGSPVHRFSGRVWVALMLFVAVTSFWIREPGEEGRIAGFSWIHILSVVTIVTVSLGLLAAFRRNVPAHRGNMAGSWIGLTIAGWFAATGADRDLPDFAADDPRQAVAALVAVLVTTVAVVVAGRLLTARAPV